jgi:hypothetical protein
VDLKKRSQIIRCPLKGRADLGATLILNCQKIFDSCVAPQLFAGEACLDEPKSSAIRLRVNQKVSAW